MAYTQAAVERTMKVHEVLMQGLMGRQPWIHIAEVLGVSARTVRRLRVRYEKHGFTGLYDHRQHRPSPRAVPVAYVQRLLRLYRDRYEPRDGHPGFNVRHLYQIACREHGITTSYSFVKNALQAAGLVRTRRARGRHRRRREPRPCFGELLHLDGSPHPWLALCPDQHQVLIAVLDDATKRCLYGQLWPAETTVAVMTALTEVFQRFGLPIAIYTDRAGWAFHTPKAGGPVDRDRPTDVGRALARLGVEHIGAYSPQARGRGERLNRTWQDRLVNELRLAGITTLEAANAYLRDHFIADYNASFTRPPTDPTSAFVPLGDVDLNQILCEEAERLVGQDNVVTFEGGRLQLAKQPGRPTCAGLRVIVRRHLDGVHTVWRGPVCLGRFNAAGQALAAVLGRASNGRFRVLGAHLPPLRARALRRPGATRQRRLGPRLPVGPGL